MLQEAESPVFPSFFRLLEFLEAKGLSFTLILRSYGQEVYDIADEIDFLIEEKGKFSRGELHLSEKILSDPRKIYATICSKRGLAIRDDYHYWREGKFQASHGKPFHVDLSNSSVLSLFFDDHIRAGADENIIGPYDVADEASLEIEKMIEAKMMIPVDTIEAIVDPNYFVNHVREVFSSFSP